MRDLPSVAAAAHGGLEDIAAKRLPDHIHTIKSKLEDLAFATRHPKRYEEIVRLVAERAPSRDRCLAQVVDRVSADLQAVEIRSRVTGRPKHYYPIYQKLVVRGRDFADIYDLVGIRVLVDSVHDCYAALGTVHASWNPVPGRFKDYVAMPKFNKYQSLHTTVIGPQGKPVEIQIRTFEMHRRAAALPPTGSTRSNLVTGEVTEWDT